MARHNGTSNLIPFSERPEEEVREMRRKGGLKSGEVRRNRKTFREQLKSMLSCNIPKDSPLYRKMKQQMKAIGIKGDPTVQDITLLGQLMKSAKDTKAAEFLRDTIGEKPTEMFEDVTPQSPIVLSLPTPEQLAAIRKRREERNAADEKASR